MKANQLKALIELLLSMQAEAEAGVSQGKAKPPKSHNPSSYKPANKYQPKGKILSEGKTERQLKNDVAVGKAFAAKGLTVVPRVDVLTYKAWLLKGLRVRTGEKGVYVKGVGTLFHLSQVATEIKLSKAEMAAETAHLG